MSTVNGISIVVCCYNSRHRLPETLKHIASQKYTGTFPRELILVNNNSTDDTVEVAKSEWKKYRSDLSFSIIDEQTPGLTAARMAGVAVSRYDYIIFCDDDNWFADTFVQKAFTIIQERPDIGALGGQSDAASDGPFPDWWDEYKHSYAVGRQGTTDGDISERKYIWGAGLVVRKILLTKIFDQKTPLLLTDRKGKSLSSGGDTEICNRVLLLGYKLYYSEKLFFTHFIPKERLTSEYRINLYNGMSLAFPILEKYSFVLEHNAIPYTKRVIPSIKMTIKICLMPLGFFRKYRNLFLNNLAIFLKSPRIAGDPDIRTIVQFLKFNKGISYK